MGVGDYAAGEEPAGDPVPSVTPSASRTRPLALQFDPVTRAHSYDATTGQYDELHPIDAKVVNALFLAFGAMPGAPDNGAAWKRIRSPWSKDAGAIAKDVVNTALAQPVRDKEIVIRSIRYEPHGSYGSFCAVEYVNIKLRTDPVTVHIPVK